MNRKTAWIGSGVVILLLLSSPAWAQVSTASLQGTVKDQTGAVMPGVELTLTHVETGSRRMLISDDQGRFHAPQLPIGNYELRAELPGFQTVVQRGIELTVGRNAVVNVVMQVGEIAETIEVSGQTLKVETTTSDLSELVDSKTMRELPLNGRNYAQLATLQVGVAFSDRVRAGNETIAGPGMRFNVNGTRYNQNSFVLDGQNVQDAFNGTPSSGSGETMGVDTLQEFEVKTANYSAEHSKAAGAVINAVTKSGTNEFHGNAFWFHRNDNLDARNFFDSSKPEFKRNQFGATIGGPIVRNRSFFFFGYEGLRQGLGLTRRFVVPTEEAKKGILGGQQIPINPVMQPYIDTLFPLEPNGADLGGGRAEHFATRTDITDDDFFVVRVDQNFSDDNSLFVRYSIQEGDLFQPAGTVFARGLPTRNQYFSVQDQHIFSPTVLNVVRGGYNRSKLTDEDVALISIPETLWFHPNGMGAISIGGFDSLGNSILRPRDFLLEVYDVSDTVSITRGKHSIKVGGNVQWYRPTLFNALWPFGSYSFPNWQGFLAARPVIFLSQAPTANPVRHYRQTLTGLFIQDDIQLTPTFTLNLGLRWESITPPSEKDDLLANPRSFDSSQIFLGEPAYENPSTDNFAPRIGWAWDIFGDGKTALRSGYGIFYSQILVNEYRTVLGGNPPFSEAFFLPRPPFPNGLDVAGSQPGPPNVFLFPFEVNQPLTHQWNLTLQRELPGATVLSVGYVGSRGVHLPRSLSNQDANHPHAIFVNGRKFFPEGGTRRNPNFGQIRPIQYDAESSYHGLQVSLRRRVAQGFQFQTSYTYAKAIDSASGIWGGNGDFAGSPPPQDILDIKSEKSASAFDVRHNLVANFSWDLPGRQGEGGIWKLLNGWQLSGILSLSTGFPFTVTRDGATDPDRNFDTTDIRPDLVPGADNNPVTGDPNAWFSTGSFVPAPPGFLGTLGRNTLRADGFSNLDLALKKMARLGETVSLQLRAEVFNLLNHANFSVPAVTEIFVANDPNPLPDAGRVESTANAARQIQFGLKLIW